jgi:hypothetical protein
MELKYKSDTLLPLQHRRHSPPSALVPLKMLLQVSVVTRRTPSTRGSRVSEGRAQRRTENLHYSDITSYGNNAIVFVVQQNLCTTNGRFKTAQNAPVVRTDFLAILLHQNNNSVSNRRNPSYRRYKPSLCSWHGVM